MQKIQNWLSKYFSFLLSFLTISLISTFALRSLVFSLGTNLLDWNDYPYYVWVVFQNIEHFRNLDLTNFFNTNIFYPNPNTLLFSDIFLPASVFGLPITYISNNPIFVFNLTFLINWALNIIAALYFWEIYTKDKATHFFATLTTALSPYVFLNMAHAQAIVLWPFLFALKFLLTKPLTNKNTLLVGIFSAILFTASVYLGIFLLLIIALWYLMELLTVKNKPNHKAQLLKTAMIFAITFLILAGPLLYKYIEVKNDYNIVREYWEYVLYSTHVTDYLFNTSFDSVISNLTPFQKWSAYNNRPSRSAFPGFVLITLAILSIFKLKITGKDKSLSIPLDKERLFWLILLISGFLFSLGPRLNVNGTFIGLHQPYHLVLKLIPIVEPIRVNTRWALLFYLGLVYFGVILLNQLKNKLKPKYFLIFVAILSFFYLLDVIPLNRPSQYVDYYPEIYKELEEQCQPEPKVLLEYPISQLIENSDVESELSYRTQQLLASVRHKCNLINGYSGHYPDSFLQFEAQLLTNLQDENEFEFFALIKSSKINIIKLNKSDLRETYLMIISTWLNNESNYSILIENDDFIIALIK